jgi:hypothetical protein
MVHSDPSMLSLNVFSGTNVGYNHEGIDEADAQPAQKMKKHCSYSFLSVELLRCLTTSAYSTHVCVCVCMSVCMYLCFFGCVPSSRTHLHTEDVCMYVCIYIYIHILYIHTYTHIHSRTLTNIHTRTCTHINTSEHTLNCLPLVANITQNTHTHIKTHSTHTLH